MSGRDLVVLGTASQAPTRLRNHNGYLLRWDGHGVLFDPGEGTQRQFTLAGVAPTQVDRICLTHLHGDHCLGLPGMLQRLALDGVDHEVPIHFPASQQAYVERLVDASVGRRCPVSLEPVAAVPGGDEVPVAEVGPLRITARALDHRIDALGYRLAEADGRRFLPDRLGAAGITGPDVGRLSREGALEVDGRRVTVEDVSEPRRGRSAAFVMDTRRCDAAVALAEGVDLLVCEATFLEADAHLAEAYAHLTAAGAARIARDAGARRLVLTHFSARYPDLDGHRREAEAVFDDVVIAEDLTTVELPPAP